MVGMLIFVLGMGVGGCAVALNQRMVDIRTDRLARENRKLQEKLHRDRVEFECSRAYRRGYFAGSKEIEKVKAKG